MKTFSDWVVTFELLLIGLVGSLFAVWFNREDFKSWYEKLAAISFGTITTALCTPPLRYHLRFEFEGATAALGFLVGLFAYRSMRMMTARWFHDGTIKRILLKIFRLDSPATSEEPLKESENDA